MEKLIVKMEYCHGIKKLDQKFDLKQTNIVYSANGIMKTSFAKSIIDYKEGIYPSDKLFPTLPSEFKFNDESFNPIDSDSLIVATNEDYIDKYADAAMTNLLVNSKLKERFNSLYNPLQTRLLDIDNMLNKLYGFDHNIILNILNIKDLSLLEIEEKNLNKEFINIKYSDLFANSFDELYKDENIRSTIEECVHIYFDIINNDASGIFFEKFDFNNLQNTFTTLLKENFFDVGHMLLLKNKKENNYKDYDKDLIKKVIDTINDKLDKDSKIKKCFKNLDKSIASRKTKNIIFSNKWLIPYFSLSENEFKKIYILSVLKYDDDLNKRLFEYIDTFKLSQKELQNIYEEAQKKENFDQWQQALDELNIMCPNFPFKISIKNKIDSVLEVEPLVLVFKYKNPKTGDYDELDKEKIIANLSTGELRIYNILKLIFDINYHKKLNKDIIIILDDIVDSFDYKNKYGILNYLLELKDNPKFHLIIFTHNFEFFRLVCLNFKDNNKIKKYQAIKDKNGNIDFISFKDVDYFNKNIKVTSLKELIATIPFVRNLLDYSQNQSDNDSSTLSTALHFSNETKALNLEKIYDIVSQYCVIEKRESGIYLENLYNEANKISCNHNLETIIDIPEKMVMAIAIRIKYEETIAKRFHIIKKAGVACTSRDLFEIISKTFKLSERFISLSNNVFILANENIHFNSFMYEPLIDSSLIEYIKLYDNVCNLKDTDFNLKDIDDKLTNFNETIKTINNKYEYYI